MGSDFVSVYRSPEYKLFVRLYTSSPLYLPYLLKFVDDKCNFYKRNYDLFSNKVKVLRESMAFFDQSTNSVYVPRGFLRDILNYLTQCNVPYRFHDSYPKLHADINLAAQKFQFRPLQQECLTALFQRLADGDGGQVVAPPAFGKTYLIASICAALPDARIDVVCRRRDIVCSTFEFLNSHFGTVGIVTSGRRLPSRRVMVYTIDSLRGEPMDAQLLILDEVHELVTDRYMEILGGYACPAIGLSATPDTRFDNLHHRIKSLTGDVVYQVTYEDAVNAGLVVPIVVQWLRPPIAKGTIRYNSLLDRSKAIWSNDARNEFIAQKARFFYQLGYQTLILTTTIEHVFALKKFLPEFEVCYAGTAAEQISDDHPRISNRERDELRRRFSSGEIKGAIATGVWSTGVSFTELQVLIRADAQASATYSVQAPGRVCRVPLKTSKAAGIVVDFTDEFSDKLFRAAKARSATYRAQGWVQLDPEGNEIERLR